MQTVESKGNLVLKLSQFNSSPRWLDVGCMALKKNSYDTLKQGDKINNCLFLWNNMNGCFYL
jgi:hypothetical protein